MFPEIQQVQNIWEQKNAILTFFPIREHQTNILLQAMIKFPLKYVTIANLMSGYYQSWVD